MNVYARHQGNKSFVLKKLQHLSREGSERRAVAEPQGLTNASTRTTCLPPGSSSFLPGPGPPLWLSQAVPQRNKGLGHQDWSGSAPMQDLAGTALPECKHPSHLRTGTPAKTLKNKLHKHLWGGWTCHNRRLLPRGRGVASRTQGQYINLQT